VIVTLRRLSWLALGLAYGHIVFGAIVRITGSGMGCGDHWPKCLGHWFPPLTRPDLIIEVSHRYIAAALTLTVLSLVGLAWWGRKKDRGIQSALGPLLLSALLVAGAAGFGALTVRFALANKAVIVTHLALALGLLGSLAAAALRLATPPGWGKYPDRSNAVQPDQRLRLDAHSHPWQRPARLLAAAAAIAFATILLGGLTAHIPGANSSCTGFPLCRGSIIPSDPNQHIQFAHRLLAYTLLALLIWLSTALARSGQRAILRGTSVALGLVLLQIGIAAALVELQLPALLRSLHQAVGTLVWVVLFGLAYSTRGKGTAPQEAPSHPGTATELRVESA
jgi:heme A synthase